MSEEKKPAPAAKAKTTTAKTAAKKKTTAAKKRAPVKKAAPKTAAKKRAAPKASPRKAAAAKTPEPDKKTATAPQTPGNEPHAETPPKQPEENTSFNKDTLIEELKDKDWPTIVIRGIFMLVFGVLCQIALSFTFFLALIQFIVMVGTGKPNETVTKAISIAATYMGQTLSFLSFKTEEKPFPFDLGFPQAD